MIYEGQNESSVFARCDCGNFKRFDKSSIDSSRHLTPNFVCQKCKRTHTTVRGYVPQSFVEPESVSVKVTLPPEGHQFPTSPQTKAQPPASSPIGILAALLIVISLGYLLFGGSSNTKPPPIDNCNNKTAAFVYGNELVQQRLKAPATAIFPNTSDSEVSISSSGNCTHTVSAYVDAQNSFGALIRTRYNITVQYIEETKRWKLISIDMAP